MQPTPDEPGRLDTVAIAAAMDRVHQFTVDAQVSGPPPEDGLAEFVEELTGHLAQLIAAVHVTCGELSEDAAMRGPAESILCDARRMLSDPPPDLASGVVLIGSFCRVLFALRAVHLLTGEIQQRCVPCGGIRVDSRPPTAPQSRHRHARMRAPHGRRPGSS
ncbi:DUF6415 family natural product biosynthesis protein [Kitasatospora sp. NPDC058046]|uniref:DUF6415 family natural product biosynthesis protein n=1 Tax=Kitasatospora sp. NPDC058046 TaxID=3346312 RepID=UPI0036DA7E67